jgi:hypothetical protein
MSRHQGGLYVLSDLGIRQGEGGRGLRTICSFPFIGKLPLNTKVHGAQRFMARTKFHGVEKARMLTTSTSHLSQVVELVNGPGA